MKAIVLGGVRSGKSNFAEEWAENQAHQHQLKVHYIATAQAFDSEMETRIQKHRQDRAKHDAKTHWTTHEEPLHLAATLDSFNSSKHLLLVDCLTLWLSNLLCHEDSTLLEQEKKKLFQSIENSKASIVMVSNEVGLGITPMGELSRRFADEAGWLHQRLAKLCDQVYFTVAGIATQLK